MKHLEKIKGMIEDELEKYGAAGKIQGVNELDQIDKLTHALKSVETVIAMNGHEERGYSGDRYGRERMDGRYSRDGGYSRGYSGGYYPEPYWPERRY